MLSKEELKTKKIEFWLDFKKHMSKFKSSNGKRVNWLNYPTEIKDLYFRLEVNKNYIAVNFDFQFKDKTVREVFWEQMYELKQVFELELGNEGNWIENCFSDVVSNFSRIQWKKEDLNYLKESNKQLIFEFFEQRLIAFDEFYQNFKEIFLFLSK
jgi:hypothetical protein